ncbi:MAG: AAA family ATPase [Spirochaetaceae bacterium]|nr:AAA family ATPase [Spirochaetaceae bacterium]
MSGRPFVALIGPRGTGKTVMLRQLRARSKDALYVSADTLERGDRLVDLVRLFLDRYRVESFFIDEIHYLPDYTADLKELFDFLPVRIWFTSSVAGALYGSAPDLSRRVRALELQPFAFREFLEFGSAEILDPLPLAAALGNEIPPAYLRTAFRFRAYLTGGLYPFMLEAGSALDLFGNIVEQVIRSDLPAHDPDLTGADLANMERLLRFVGRSPIDGINYTSLARNLAITKYKAEQYVGALERAFVLRQAFPAGANVLREPKVFMEPPYRLLYRSYDDCIGALREDFFALAMAQHAMPFRYAKSTRGAKTPDFVVALEGRDCVIEVGGRGKGRSQFKGLTYDRKVVLFHGDDQSHTPGARVPLHCIGFA